jgi:CheY-like chemotaxis protein
MEKLSSIVLIDDDTTTNFLNELLLQRLEVAERVLVAENGAQALDLLALLAGAAEPALVLLDVNMPGLTGVQFLEAYRQLPAASAAAPVIIMLTTSLDARDLSRLDELGVAGLLHKPLTPVKISELLHRHFPRQLSTDS